MVTVYVKNDCGCCTTAMEFNSLQSAEEAFAKVGFGNGMSIVDDAGQEHGGVDTFYGFSTDEDEQSSRSLGYLVELISGSRK